MSALLEQLPTLIGVMLGALMSYGASALTERSTWRRAQAARWDERRLQAYADYAAALKTEIRLCLRMATSLNLATSTHPLAPEAGVELLEEAEDRRSQLFENLLLLAQPSTIEAARKWQRAV
jgi:hypothetical protein